MTQPAIKMLAADKPVALADLSLTLDRAPLTLLCAALDEPLLLITSTHRMLLITMRDLLQQRAAGIDLFHLYGFDRGEQICLLQRWAEMRERNAFVLVSTQGYARKFDMAQLRPAVEGPTPSKLDWTLPGWPRLALGAEEDDDITLITALGRGLRVPAAAIRRTGTRVLHKPKADEIIAACATTAATQLWLLASEGYAKWLPAAAVPRTAEGGPGAVIVRRRGELCAVMAAPNKPLYVVTTNRLVPLDPGIITADDAGSQTMHKALKLGQGEQVLGVLR